MKNNIIKGDELMLFVKDDSEYKSIAQATSHTLTLSASTESIASKDYGKFGHTVVNKIDWEITSDNLFIADEYNKLVGLMLTGGSLDIVFGFSASDGNSVSGLELKGDAWSVDTAKKNYKGKAVITSLTLNAGSGANATYSITLSGDGELEQVNAQA